MDLWRILWWGWLPRDALGRHPRRRLSKISLTHAKTPQNARQISLTFCQNIVPRSSSDRTAAPAPPPGPHPAPPPSPQPNAPRQPSAAPKIPSQISQNASQLRSIRGNSSQKDRESCLAERGGGGGGQEAALGQPHAQRRRLGAALSPSPEHGQAKM